MIYPEDRGNYHFIKFNAVPEIDFLIQRVYSALDYYNKNNTAEAKLLLSAVANQAAVMSQKYNYWGENPKAEKYSYAAEKLWERKQKIITQVWANRFQLAGAIRFALIAPLEKEMLYRGFVKFTDPNKSWNTADTGIGNLNIQSHTETGLSRVEKKHESSFYILFMDQTATLANISDIQRHSGGVNMMQHIYKKYENGYEPFDLRFYLPQNIYKRIYAYLSQRHQVSLEMKGREMFLYLAKAKETSSLPIINFSIDFNRFKWRNQQLSEVIQSYSATNKKFMELYVKQSENFSKQWEADQQMALKTQQNPLFIEFSDLVKKESEGTITNTERKRLSDIKRGYTGTNPMNVNNFIGNDYKENIAFHLVETEVLYNQLIKK